MRLDHGNGDAGAVLTIGLRDILGRHGAAHTAELAMTAAVLVETPYASALNRYVEFQTLLAELDLVLWEEVLEKAPGPDEPQGPEWIGGRVAEVIGCAAALERELYPAAARIAVRAPHGPGPRAALGD